MVLNLCAVWSIMGFAAPVSNIIGVDVQFRMFTSGDPNVYTQFTLDRFDNQIFDITKDYIILTHGWLADFEVNWYTKTIESFGTRPNSVNTVIITTGYEEAMNCKLYFGSVLNVPSLGKTLSKLLINMHNLGIPLKNVEMVGHSLGAHIAGIASETAFRATGAKVRRIFGLDPAGPLKRPMWINRHRRLHKGDAEKVIIFHTSVIGTRPSIGDVDFFPNGGRNQNECGKLHDSDHNVAAYYFACSVTDDCINYGYKCKDYNDYLNFQCFSNENALMGYDVADSAEGDYFLSVHCT